MNRYIWLFWVLIGLWGGGNSMGAVTYTNADFPNVPASIAENVTFNIDTTSSPTYSGVVSGTGTTFTKTGAGTLTLSGQNTYAGTTTISAGTLKLTSERTINYGNSRTTVTIGADGTLELSGSNNAAGKNRAVGAITINGGKLTATSAAYHNIGMVTLNGGTIVPYNGTTDLNAGSFLFYDAVNVTENSSITGGRFMIRNDGDDNRGKWTVADGKTLTISSTVLMGETGGNGTTWEKLGGGTILLNGTGMQLVTGTGVYTDSVVKITAGTVAITNANTLGGSRVQMNGGTLRINMESLSSLPNNFQVTANSTLDAQNAHNYYLGGTLSGTGNLTMFSSNNGRFGIFLDGSSSGYTGTFTVVDSTTDAFLVMNRNTDISRNRVHLDGTQSHLSYLVDSNQLTYKVGMISGNGQVRALASFLDGQTTTIQVGNDTAYTTAESTFSGTIYDHKNQYIVAIEKVGSNTWTLSGNNTYTGGTKVSGGTLKITNTSALGTGAVTMNGGALDISATGNTYFSNVVRGTGTLTASGTNWFNFTGSLKDFAGTFYLNTGGGMNLHSDTGDASKVCFAVSPNCGSLSLIDTGAGISVGMITGGKTDGSQSSRPSSSSGAMTTLKVGNDTEYANHTWNGAFWENNADKKLSIEKVGSNTWTWTSGNHTFTGGLTVSEGVLELSSTANVKNSAVTVKNGGILSNAGTVGKAITVEAGGTYEGVAGSTVSLVTLQEGGILTGNAAFNANTLRLVDYSVLAFDLDALTSMSLSDVVFPDHLIVDVAIDDPTDAYNQTYNLFSVDSNVLDSLDFLFSDNTSVVWATGYTNGNVWVRGYNPADVPEPASWILLLAAGGLMWRFRRRG